MFRKTLEQCWLKWVVWLLVGKQQISFPRKKTTTSLRRTLINRLHRANPIPAQVELEAAIGSAHHFTMGGKFFVHA